MNAQKTETEKNDSMDKLIKAIIKNDFVTFKSILDDGSVDAINARYGRDNEPLLLIVTRHKRPKMMKHLLINKGVPVDAVNSFNKTALHVAGEVGYPIGLAILLAKKADPNAESWSLSYTPAFYVVNGEYPETIKLIMLKRLKKHNADLTKTDRLDNNLLHSAVRRRDWKVEAFLEKEGVSPSERNYNREIPSKVPKTTSLCAKLSLDVKDMFVGGARDIIIASIKANRLKRFTPAFAQLGKQSNGNGGNKAKMLV